MTPTLFQYFRVSVFSLRPRAWMILVKRAMTSSRGVVRSHSMALATAETKIFVVSGFFLMKSVRSTYGPPL